MAMIKTDKARQALRNRASLSVQERQILILCDGVRSRQEIAGWLGDSALALMDALVAQGFLQQRPVLQATSAGKRSLAACKMYAQGILQMQRSAAAQQMLAQLNSSQDEGDLLRTLQELLHFLQQKTNTSYAETVKNHLRQIVPDSFVYQLDMTPAAYI